jgi:hypothetical protein
MTRPSVLEELAGTMTSVEMQALNQSVQKKKSLRDVAVQFLQSKGLLTGERQAAAPRWRSAMAATPTPAC